MLWNFNFLTFSIVKLWSFFLVLCHLCFPSKKPSLLLSADWNYLKLILQKWPFFLQSTTEVRLSVVWQAWHWSVEPTCWKFLTSQLPLFRLWLRSKSVAATIFHLVVFTCMPGPILPFDVWDTTCQLMIRGLLSPFFVISLRRLTNRFVCRSIHCCRPCFWLKTVFNVVLCLWVQSFGQCRFFKVTLIGVFLFVWVRGLQITVIYRMFFGKKT